MDTEKFMASYRSNLPLYPRVIEEGAFILERMLKDAAELKAAKEKAAQADKDAGK